MAMIESVSANKGNHEIRAQLGSNECMEPQRRDIIERAIKQVQLVTTCRRRWRPGTTRTSLKDGERMEGGVDLLYKSVSGSRSALAEEFVMRRLFHVQVTVHISLYGPLAATASGDHVIAYHTGL